VRGCCSASDGLVGELKRARRNYSVTGFSEICQSLLSKIEMWSVFIGE
jgi:hypothetical protein